MANAQAGKSAAPAAAAAEEDGGREQGEVEVTE